ncbi:XapX domain-containing protein [Paraburkholderia sp. Ac-20336]|uniref:DUF1427 family protein n=1 Tax=Burkholderiaceae TaxID=119060 RepID=UPI00141FB4BC|nr:MULTISPECIES: DUF1427 family protein [Burkholderiaceae]MBN3803837.1 XapX domain-containing protein [Paraburkholderia sp. Ac-20336]MBN3849470.1 XapX domain-containing protein [Paraburkholderia sp. Ac-20342]NIF52841.1 DUF1427 family protein [Burkholderia sp. Ax-1724]
MKSYLLSLAAGLLVGLVYSLLKVRSPAPPLIALVGLLGILIGEQALPTVKRLMSESSAATNVHARSEQTTSGQVTGLAPRPTRANEDTAGQHQP